MKVFGILFIWSSCVTAGMISLVKYSQPSSDDRLLFAAQDHDHGK